MIVNSLRCYVPETVHDHGVSGGSGVFGEGFAAGGLHGVVTGVAEDVVQLAAAYALVAPVIEGEHHGVAHDPLERGQVFGVAGDADHPHAVVNRRDGRFGAVDLRHDRQLFRPPAGALEIMARLPGEVAAGLDPATS